MEASDELFVKLLTSPYWENKHIHQDSNGSANSDAVQTFQCSDNWVAIAVSRDYDKTVRKKGDPKEVFVWNQWRPLLHKGGYNSCIRADYSGFDDSVYIILYQYNILLLDIAPFRTDLACQSKHQMIPFFKLIVSDKRLIPFFWIKPMILFV